MTDIQNTRNGYLYCVKNKAYGINTYKLGRTANFGTRMPCYNTYYIDKCEVLIASKKFDDVVVAEQMLFVILDEYRVKEKNEFFKCSMSIIKDAFIELENELSCRIDEVYNDYKKVETVAIKNNEHKYKFMCNKCDYKTDHKNHFTRHNASYAHKHNIKHEDYTCGVCGKQLTYKGSKYRHSISCAKKQKKLSDKKDAIIRRTNRLLNNVTDN